MGQCFGHTARVGGIVSRSQTLAGRQVWLREILVGSTAILLPAPGIAQYNSPKCRDVVHASLMLQGYNPCQAQY